jgi:hypothetical protein
LRAVLLFLGVFAVVGIVLVAGWSLVLRRLPVYHTSRKSVVRPAHYTSAEEDAFTTALVNGDLLPAGWIAADEGEVTGKFTGVIDPFHLQAQVLVTLTDAPDHVESATFEVNGVVAASVSRAAGTVVDEDGKAQVRIRAMIPFRGRRAFALKWTSTTGEVRSSSMSL